MLRSFFLAPCLLICLACATPLPIESLEAGMTYETVREKFGEPEAIMVAAAAREAYGAIFALGPETELGGVELYWSYVDEKQTWQSFLFPQFVLLIPYFAAKPDTPWDAPYVNRRPVLLHFEAEKLVHWRVGEFYLTGQCADCDAMLRTMELQRFIESAGY